MGSRKVPNPPSPKAKPPPPPLPPPRHSKRNVTVDVRLINEPKAFTAALTAHGSAVDQQLIIEKLEEALSLAIQWAPVQAKLLSEQHEVDGIHELVKETTLLRGSR